MSEYLCLNGDNNTDNEIVEIPVCKDCGSRLDNDTSRCIECWEEIMHEKRTAHHYYAPSDEPWEENKYPWGGEERIKPLNF